MPERQPHPEPTREPCLGPGDARHQPVDGRVGHADSQAAARRVARRAPRAGEPASNLLGERGQAVGVARAADGEARIRPAGRPGRRAGRPRSSPDQPRPFDRTTTTPPGRSTRSSSRAARWSPPAGRCCTTSKQVTTSNRRSSNGKARALPRIERQGVPSPRVPQRLGARVEADDIADLGAIGEPHAPSSPCRSRRRALASPTGPRARRRASTTRAATCRATTSGGSRSRRGGRSRRGSRSSSWRGGFRSSWGPSCRPPAGRRRLGAEFPERTERDEEGP